MSVAAFLGPTLAGVELPQDTLHLPPARQGDIFRVVRDRRPKIVALIDGVFLDVPAVWHREILWALNQGVHVLGAASMGALRAAELHPFGMIGIGQIYQAFRDGFWPGFPEPFEDDDEVAIVHAPAAAAAGGAALSDAMVDLRATLRLAVASGMLDDRGCHNLAAQMKALAFPRRSFAALAAAVSDPALAAWIEVHAVRQKAIDARALLDQVSTIGPAPFVPAFRFTRALAWERFVQAQSQPAPSPLLARLRDARPAAWRALRREALGRLAALVAQPASEEAAREAFDRFRIERGLVRYEDIQAWLRQNDMDATGLARLMREEATLDEAADAPGLEQAMLDVLRLTGRLPEIGA